MSHALPLKHIYAVNKLSIEEKVKLVAALVEGCFLRSTVRMTGIHRTAIQNLLVELGAACSENQGKVFVTLPCKRLQCDAIWSFVGCMAKNVPAALKGKSVVGDVWTWTALFSDTKLVRIPAKADTDSENNRTPIPIQIGQLSERSDARVLAIRNCPK